MSMTLSSIRIAVRTVSFNFEKSNPASVMWATRLSEPRLHTAISSREVLGVICVRRFELCTTPTCCCGLLRLQGSWQVIDGCLVSNSMHGFLRHSWVRGSLLENVATPRDGW